MTPILLVGASSPSGAAFLRLASDRDLTVLGRIRPSHAPQVPFRCCDLADPEPAQDLTPAGAVLVSFAPIWLLAPFLTRLLGGQDGPTRAGGQGAGLAGVVACSSSSVLTKRFAANRADRALVNRLRAAEEELEAACGRVGVSCRILQPTLIYGQEGPYGDRNLSRLLGWMASLPCLPVPAASGLRQPIHASQLAAVALHLVDRPEAAPLRTPLGGDETLTYAAMLERLQQAMRAQDPAHPAGHCRLLTVPEPCFHLLAAPLLPLSPRSFEAVLRMQADLAGFPTAGSLLGRSPLRFPVSPLATPPRAPTRAIDAAPPA